MRSVKAGIVALAVVTGASSAFAASAMVDRIYVAYAVAMGKRLPLKVDATSTIVDVRYNKAVGLSQPATIEYDVTRADIGPDALDAGALAAALNDGLRAHYCGGGDFQSARNDRVGIVFNVHAANGTLVGVAAVGPATAQRGSAGKAHHRFSRNAPSRRRSSCVMPVSLPSGIALPTIACSMIASAYRKRSSAPVRITSPGATTNPG